MVAEWWLLEMTLRNNPMDTLQHSDTEQAGSEIRRAYGPPRLTVFGNLRGITLGGSPGAGDSGMSNEDPPMFFSDDYIAIP